MWSSNYRSEHQNGKRLILLRKSLKDVVNILNYGEGAVSVAFEEIISHDSAEKVYRSDFQSSGQVLQQAGTHDVNNTESGCRFFD